MPKPSAALTPEQQFEIAAFKVKAATLTREELLDLAQFLVTQHYLVQNLTMCITYDAYGFAALDTRDE